MKILVAEDDRTSQELLRRILKQVGECTIVDDGEAAVQTVLEAYESGDPFDVLFLDIMMPKLDGQATLQQIRTEEEKRGIAGLDGLRIIMLTALEDTSNILGAFRTGAEAYLTKPI
ncbi:MAG: response regulator, partial [Bdellovibrionales bacterium]|nr:response regulator [Bdellovibrionales bacterium]